MVRNLRLAVNTYAWCYKRLPLSEHQDLIAGFQMLL